MIPIDIQVSRSKVKPTLHMLGKGGICVLHTAIFQIIVVHAQWLCHAIGLRPYLQDQNAHIVKNLYGQ